MEVAHLARLATETWRIRRALATQERIARNLPGAAAMRYAIRSMEQTFADLGIEILDFQGQAYSPGMCMQVEYADGVADDSPATIMETLEPTIRISGEVIAAGRVVVATVAQEETPSEK